MEQHPFDALLGTLSEEALPSRDDIRRAIDPIISGILNTKRIEDYRPEEVAASIRGINDVNAMPSYPRIFEILNRLETIAIKNGL